MAEPAVDKVSLDLRANVSVVSSDLGRPLVVATPPSAVQAQQAPKARFKVLVHVLMALKRFQDALNPTYSYGKRQQVDDPHQHAINIAKAREMAAQQARTSTGKTASGRVVSGRTASGRPTEAGKQHGFKGNLLFKPLPETEAVQS